jgi:hypothetical protein
MDDLRGMKDAERTNRRGEDSRVKRGLRIPSMVAQEQKQPPTAEEAVEHLVSNGPIKGLEVSVDKFVVEAAFAFHGSEYSPAQKFILKRA